jgi:hypothetical protein
LIRGFSNANNLFVANYGYNALVLPNSVDMAIII